MNRRSLSHLTNRDLLHGLAEVLGRSRGDTAELLLHLGEVQRRRLHVSAGYPSMFAYCVEVFHFSEDSACKRIRAARAARKYPQILDMVADGRLHLSAVVLLAPFLDRAPAGELLASAVHRSKRQIEQMLAERFPKSDVPEQVRPIVTQAPGHVAAAAPHSAPGRMEISGPTDANSNPGPALLSAPGRMEPEAGAPAPVASPAPYPRVAPLAPERYAVQFTMDQPMHDDLRRAQALLGHTVGPNEIVEVFRRALSEMVTSLEKRKFAATSKPRIQTRPSRSRHIPAAIKHEVWKRDQGHCTFVAENGRACSSRTALEFDHVKPVALGGRTEARNLRLLCRAHNQHAADIALGAGFMHEVRERTRRSAAGASARFVEARGAPAAQV